MGELRALPREIAPLRDLRPPLTVAGRRPAGRRSRREPRLRAAAAVVALMGAATLVWYSTDGPAGRDTAIAERSAAVAATASIEPYTEATRDLLAAFRARQTELAPEAARIIQRNLAVVDAAIRELERARSRAPDDAAISRLLEARYRTKLELLRDAVALLSKA